MTLYFKSTSNTSDIALVRMKNYKTVDRLAAAVGIEFDIVRFDGTIRAFVNFKFDKNHKSHNEERTMIFHNFRSLMQLCLINL